MISTLSPSGMATFQQCPQRFQFAKLDLLPDPPGIEAIRGQIVHDALRRLYGEPQGARTREAAQNCLDAALEDAAWSEDFLRLDLTAVEREELPWQCFSLIHNYFEMENPDDVSAIGLELHLAVQFAGVLLHGHLDRLDRTDLGAIVVDYKTGKAPARRYQAEALAQLFIYAYLVREVVGTAPYAVRLLYLRDKSIIEVPVDEPSHLRTAESVRERWGAICAAIASDSFPAQPSPLCGWCAYRPICPAHAGPAPDGE